jgi:hypothetical protein
MKQANSEILQILDNVVGHLKQPDCDVSWSHYDNQTEALADIERHITNVKRGETSDIQELRLLFLPTGSIQEIAINNGWGDEFLDLAARFDKAIEG